ncbi:hypothetical protein K6V92_00345 [Cupriavidus respiraculi]|uniref:hypothetical protein n=1 Tax=Cupriavidus respiraculi TaxID=195930 RepID=UPI001C9765F0|nr:hypothetical protein [Cupriavidus respiraculi]MBY4945073.1 hypothetical protein [Cupriavidus respiraculi]
MKGWGALILVMATAGCGSVRYIGTEAEMQQVARGAAELMKKDPYSQTVASAGTGAHMALSAMLAPKPQESECVPTLSGGCLQSWQTHAEPAKESEKTLDAYTGLPTDFYKSTSIGKD